MKNEPESQLIKIIKRLYTMKNDKSSDFQIRRFDLFGVETIKVTYNRENNVFSINNYRKNQTFIFDDIELAAIEIYQTLNELKLTF